jgi:hypothetical protein
MQRLKQLRALIDEIPSRLKELQITRVELKPSPSKWSPKEELGHLLDSAANNHQRIVRTQLEDKPKMPGYDDDASQLARNDRTLASPQPATARCRRARLCMVANLHHRRLRAAHAKIRLRRLHRPHAAPPKPHWRRNGGPVAKRGKTELRYAAGYLPCASPTTNDERPTTKCSAT